MRGAVKMGRSNPIPTRHVIVLERESMAACSATTGVAGKVVVFTGLSPRRPLQRTPAGTTKKIRMMCSAAGPS